MLSDEDKAIISAGFNIYDHNWQFYEELLGSVCRVGNVLAYCDGAGLYICAMSLGKLSIEFNEAEIEQIIHEAFEKLSPRDVKFIDIWGQFSSVSRKYTGSYGDSYFLSEQSPYFDGMFDSIFDIHKFDTNPSKAARKKMRQLKNSGVVTTVSACSVFGHEHLSVFENWIREHDISATHREFFFTLPSYIKKPSVFVCEARINSQLVGFSIVGVVSDERMVLHSAFPLRNTGWRVGDSLFFESIEFARRLNIRWLHAGYSANADLLKSKEEWGAMTRSAPFKEAFYITNEEYRSMIATGRFLWRTRIQDMAGQKPNKN